MHSPYMVWYTVIFPDFFEIFWVRLASTGPKMGLQPVLFQLRVSPYPMLKFFASK